MTPTMTTMMMERDRTMEREEKQLWQRYQRARQRTRSRVAVELRNALAERYLSLCKQIAAKYDLRTPDSVEFGDIYSAAYQGLLDGLPRYCLGRGTAPSTFLSYRIVGRIRDFLRASDELTRTQRTRHQRVEQWEQTELGRPATTDEIDEHFGFRLVYPPTISIDAAARNDYARDLRLSDVIADGRTGGDLADAAYLLRSLSQRERLIVLLYYVEGYSMKQVGETLDLSESRISQMMGDILKRMRRNAQAA